MVAVRKVLEAEEVEPAAPVEVGALAMRLEDRLVPGGEKRRILAALAAQGGPEASQVLRRYLAEPDPGLESAALAALEQVSARGGCDRNSACPCGSGATWKRCCAREQIDWSRTRKTRRADLSAPWRSR